MSEKERRLWIAALACDAVLFCFALFGVLATFLNFYFMMDLGRLTEASFAVTFTGQSNMLVGLVALVCFIFRLKDRKRALPAWLFVVRLISVALISITFLITAGYLSPSVGAEWWRLYINSSLFNHLLTPLLAIVSFLVLEPRTDLGWRCCLYSLIPMGAYGIFYLTRAYTHVGPDGKIDYYYDIYGFARFGIGGTIGLFAAFMAFSLGLTYGFYVLNRKKKQR